MATETSTTTEEPEVEEVKEVLKCPKHPYTTMIDTKCWRCDEDDKQYRNLRDRIVADTELHRLAEVAWTAAIVGVWAAPSGCEPSKPLSVMAYDYAEEFLAEKNRRERGE